MRSASAISVPYQWWWRQEAAPVQCSKYILWKLYSCRGQGIKRIMHFLHGKASYKAKLCFIEIMLNSSNFCRYQISSNSTLLPSVQSMQLTSIQKREDPVANPMPDHMDQIAHTPSPLNWICLCQLPSAGATASTGSIVARPCKSRELTLTST